MFKGYLKSNLEAKDKHLPEESKLIKESSRLQFKGNRMFQLNANLSQILSAASENIDSPWKKDNAQSRNVRNQLNWQTKPTMGGKSLKIMSRTIS